MENRNGALREEQFRRVMSERGVMLTRPTVTFKFQSTSYLPDWYDAAQDIYYEVIGSRQRGHQLRPKLDLMRLVHPNVVLRVMTPAGEHWRHGRDRSQQFLRDLPHGAAVLDRAQAEGLTTTEVCAALGVNNYALHHHGSEPWLAARLAAFAARQPVPRTSRTRHRRQHPRRMFKHRRSCGQRCLDIMEMYALGTGTPRIGELLGLSASGVLALLRLHGVRTRPVGYLKGKSRPTYRRREAM